MLSVWLHVDPGSCAALFLMSTACYSCVLVWQRAVKHLFRPQLVVKTTVRPPGLQLHDHVIDGLHDSKMVWAHVERAG